MLSGVVGEVALIEEWLNDRDVSALRKNSHKDPQEIKKDMQELEENAKNLGDAKQPYLLMLEEANLSLKAVKSRFSVEYSAL